MSFIFYFMFFFIAYLRNYKSRKKRSVLEMWCAQLFYMPNSHLRTRLTQQVPLRVSQRENNRKTALHRCHQIIAKIFIWHTFLWKQTGNQHPLLFCGPGDICFTVDAWRINGKVNFHFIEMYARSSAMYSNHSLSLGVIWLPILKNKQTL